MHGRITQRQAPKRKPDWRKEREEYYRQERRSIYAPGAQWVNVYRLEQNYGGPEEGGRWFDSWEFIEGFRVRNLTRAFKLREKLERKYPNHGNRYNSNYWNKPQDFAVRIEKSAGEDGGNWEPYC